MVRVNKQELKFLLSDEELDFLANLYMETKDKSTATFEQFLNKYSQEQINEFLKNKRGG